MPNKLEKTPLPTGGGGGGGSGGGGGGGGGSGGGGSLPPEGSPCFTAIAARISELWPQSYVEYVRAAGYFKLTTPGGTPGVYTKVTGSCSNGYVALNYELVGRQIGAS